MANNNYRPNFRDKTLILKKESKMKKGKIFSICLAVGAIIASFCFIFLSLGGGNESPNDGTQVYSSYSRGESYASTQESSRKYTNLKKSNIPFSLYTSFLPTGDDAYQITDYYPDAQETEHSYIMGVESAPYILLSSKTGSAGSILSELYNTNLTFKFNDTMSKNDPTKNYATIPFTYLTTYTVTLQNAYSTEPIKIRSQDYLLSNTDDYSFEFKLNLKKYDEVSGYCPILEDGSVLGGDVNNDPSYRTGLYTINLTYNYLLDGKTVGLETFRISFYIIDYSDYISTDNTAPLTISNASKFEPTLEGQTLTNDYYLYNYDFDNAPQVGFDASKFALNFKYYVGSNEDSYYEFLYKGFTVSSSPDYTGYVTIECAKLNKSYRIYTHSKTIEGTETTPEKTIQYYATFDLKDFEDNFILPNSDAMQTSVFQGKYMFSLDVLTAGKSDSVFVKVDKNLFGDEVQKNLSFQNLVIFGYDLRYTDNDANSATYGKNLSLIKENITHTNVLSFNQETDDKHFTIPNKIATTNLAPLRFHSYGDLATGEEKYKAKYILINDLNSTKESEILQALNDAKTNANFDILNTTYFLNKTTATYSQFANFTSEGIYLVNLKYTITLNTTVQKEVDGKIEYDIISNKIDGTQYVLFEIDNSTQGLYIHAIERTSDGLFAYDFNNYTNKNVRVAVEERDNLFSASTSVVYSLSQTFDSTISSSGTLTLKRDANGTPISYVLNGKTYNYYVLYPDVDYTFSTSGAYNVSVRRNNSNYPRYTFKIDKLGFSDVSVNEALLTTSDTYIKGDKLSSTSLSSGGFIDRNLYVTDGAFTLGWKEKESGAKISVYVALMQLKEDSTRSSALIKQQDGSEYWLTNNYYLTDTMLNADTTYQNSYTLTNLNINNYFDKEGLYYFFIYDQAGNYTSVAVLIDSSLPAIAQGEWSGSIENSNWINTYNPSDNPNNFINSNTYLYFGTHKAIGFSSDINGLSNIEIEIDNRSCISAYDLDNNGEVATVQNIKFDFKQDVLFKLSDYIKLNQGENLFYAGSDNYYLVIANQRYDYTYTPTSIYNKTGEAGTQVINSSNYYVGLYKQDEPGLPRKFSGEANYEFTVTNFAEISSTRKINMNFEKVKTAFYAYNQPDQPIYIEKGAGTNLSTLRFEYELVNDEIEAKYYQIASLTYTYYPFALSQTDAGYDATTYPFSKLADGESVDMLARQEKKNNLIYVIDGINMNTLGETKPGKYVVTRRYVGGEYEYDGVDASGNPQYKYVGTGGSYYKTETDTYINLFTFDRIERTYEVYVDNNKIIDSSKGVGNNITMTLGNENPWTFVDFNKMSTGIDRLVTNLTPVKINIPFNKYFLKTTSGYVASRFNFSYINFSVTFTNKSGLTTTYVADGFDSASGLMTCSKLVSPTNQEGFFILSEEGQYVLTISDNTGYTLSTSSSVLYNENPTQMTFSFTISYSSLTADGYSYIGDSRTGTFKTTKLTSEKAGFFSTNAPAISSTNEEGNKLNKIFLAYEDGKTPYLAKVKRLNIFSKLKNQSFYINTLGEEKLKSMAIDGTVLALVNDASQGYTIQTLTRTELATRDYLCYLEVNFYDENSEYETFDGKDYYRFTYKLYFTLLNEDEFTVELLTSDNADSIGTATYILSVDRTKPNTNLDNLLTEERFINQNYSSTKFKDEEIFNTGDTDISSIFYANPNNLTYSFGISNTYSLSYNSDETVPYFYVRSYNKYNGDYPSITPDMAGSVYMTSQEFANYPRFSELTLINGIINIGSSTWYKINYSSVSLYNQILTATSITPQGHYEIIEKDNAGNFRTFTVYFATNEPLIIIDGIDSDNKTYEENTDDNLTANITFQISKLASKLGWGIITLRNETLGVNFEKNITLVPDNNILTQDLRLSIIEFMSAQNVNSRFSFTLQSYNYTFPTSTRSVSVITNKSTAKLDAPIVNEETIVATNTKVYKLAFPAYSEKTVLYLTGLTLMQYAKDIGSWRTILNLTNKDDIRAINDNGKGYLVDKGIYRAIYKDNYNINTYEYNIYVGEYLINDFDKEFEFENEYLLDSATNTYYTGGSVDVTFEANIYSILVNGQAVTNIRNSSTLADKNCKTFTLSSSFDSSNATAKDRIGGATEYIIDYVDITNTVQKTIKIVIFDELPEILLTNGNDDSVEIGSTTFESTSQITNSIVRVNWGQITDCDFELLNDSDSRQVTQAILYTRNNDGSYSFKENLQNGAVIVDEGFYMLELKNSILGNSRYVYFAIQFGEFPLYTVTSNNEEIHPSSLERLNITTTYKEGTEKRLLDIIYDKLTENKDKSALSQIVDRDKSAYRVILEAFGYRLNSLGQYVFSASDIGIANVTNLNHYYSISDTEIIYNSNIDLDIIEFLFENDELIDCYIKGETRRNINYSYATNYYTTIYLVYSLKRTTKIELFATTRVPSLSNASLLGSALYYGANSRIDLTMDRTSKELTNSPDVKNDKVVIGFDSFKYGSELKWYNQGNYIYCLEQYGMDDGYTIVDFTSTTSAYNYVTLKGAGTHKLKFMDLAGNVHKFTTNSFDTEPEVYTLYIITKVVYYIRYNDNLINPIESAIYNDSVSLELDSNYTQKTGFTYNISVVRNGQKYENYEYLKENNLYTFSEAGRYVVTFSGSYKNVELENAVYNFTILSTTSARLAYEFSEIAGYEIVKVMRNNVDITSNFIKDGKITSLFISSSDSRSGNGYYTVTLKYGDRATDRLTYSFLINDYVPSISCSIPYGETTTSNIDISYNPSYIYNQLGRCYIVVYVYNTDSNAFYEFARFAIDENETSSISTFTLTRSYSYFVQVKTETGNTISSFRVNKTDPLNTFAIIIIIVSVVAVTVLIIVIIKLRTRMRVK